LDFLTWKIFDFRCLRNYVSQPQKPAVFACKKQIENCKFLENTMYFLTPKKFYEFFEDFD
ncbi:MAG: hypothetical protein ABFD07_05575, partial [Methanobacterium sp.]